MIDWIKAHPMEMGLILAGIPIIISVVAGAFSSVQYVIIRRAEMRQKNFENYHQLIHELVHGRAQDGSTRLDSQIACIFELRNFKNYREVSIRILEGLKESWCKGPVYPRLGKDIDLTLAVLREK